MSILSPLFKPKVERLKAKRDVEGLIRALNYRSWWSHEDVNCSAVIALAEFGDTRAIEPMIALYKEIHDQYILARVDVNTCVAIIQSLGKMREKRYSYLGFLNNALHDEKSPDIKRAAVWALEETGGEAVYYLGEALNDKDIFLEVTLALGRMGDKSAIKPLEISLSKGNPLAADALDKLGWKPGKDATAAWYWIAKKEYDRCIEIGAIGIKQLIAMLEMTRDFRSEDRLAVVRTLGKTKNINVINALIIALKDNNSEISNAAMEELVKIGQPAVMDLNALLSNDANSDRIRAVAAQTLEKLGNTQAVQEINEDLIESLKGGEKSSRKAAAKTLDSLGWKPGTGELEAWYRIAREEWDRCAQIGLAAVDPLIHTLNDFLVRERVTQVLAKIGEPAINALISAFKLQENIQVRSACEDALAMIGAPAVEPLIDALQNEDLKTRISSASALGKIRDVRAVEPLITALKSRDEQVRWVSAKALGDIKDDRAINPLAEYLKNDPGSDYVVANALISIGDQGDDANKRAIQRLLMEIKNSLASEQIAQALIRWGSDYLPPEWTKYDNELQGNIGVSINNPNGFKVRVGIRSGNGGRDFMVPAENRSTINLPVGSYKIYFQYFNEPSAIYQGDDFTLNIDTNSLEISLVKTSSGNYHIKKI